MRYSNIIALMVMVVLQSCAMQDVQEAAATIRLKHATEVSNQRGLVISPLSTVGLYIDTERARPSIEASNNILLEKRLKELYQGLNQAFYRQFVQLIRLDNARSINRNIDFVIEAYILKMTLTEKTVIVTPVSLLDTESLGVEEHEEIIIPTDYLDIKFLLKDARSNKIIDISHLKARSGQLDYYKGYADFADHSIAQYLETITP